NPYLNLKDDEEEEYKEGYVHTPKNYEFTDDEEECDELYKDVNVRLYTAEFEKKVQDEKKRYIDLIEKSVKEIIKDEVNTQLPQILPKEVSDFATPVIQSTITKSLENVILAKSSSQLQSTYEAAASLTEFKLKKILLDKL
nr:hypothetical protein [Tanacetum cinerariifolium]